MDSEQFQQPLPPAETQKLPGQQTGATGVAATQEHPPVTATRRHS